MSITIEKLELVQTSALCPEQYDVYKGGRKVGYMRVRHGFFIVEAPYCGGKVVYQAHVKGDGSFDDGERMEQLTAGVRAIKSWLKAEKQKRKDN